MIRRKKSLLLLGLACVVILVGCKGRQTQSPTPEAVAVQASPTVTAATSSTPAFSLATPYPEIVETVNTVYPAPANPAQTAYPAPTEAPTAYPNPVEPTQPVYPNPSDDGLDAYAAPTQPPAAYPAPTQPPAAYPGLTQPPTAYPGPTQPPPPYPGPTQSAAQVITASPTSGIPSAVPGTAIPTNTLVPTNTPLPTLTPAPTSTPTPELPPPIRTELSATDPDQFQLNSGDVQLVEFFAYWCVTCRSMAPMIHSFEALYGDQMNFIYLDIDDPANAQFEKALGYRYQPHFFLLDKDGKILQQWIGWMTPEDLRNAIEAALR